MPDPQRPTWSCGHPVSPNPSLEEARLHVGHKAQQRSDATLWVRPVVSAAEVDPHHTTCDQCGALMLVLTIGGLHDQGVVGLPPILICPDCVNAQQVVAEWRERVRKGRHA